MDNPHGTRRTVVATLVALPAVIAFPIRADATERRWRALIEEVSRDHANGRAAALVAYSFRAQIDPATLVQVVGYEHRQRPGRLSAPSVRTLARRSGPPRQPEGGLDLWTRRARDRARPDRDAPALAWGAALMERQTSSPMVQAGPRLPPLALRLRARAAYPSALAAARSGVSGRRRQPGGRNSTAGATTRGAHRLRFVEAPAGWSASPLGAVRRRPKSPHVGTDEPARRHQGQARSVRGHVRPRRSTHGGLAWVSLLKTPRRCTSPPLSPTCAEPLTLRRRSSRPGGGSAGGAAADDHATQEPELRPEAGLRHLAQGRRRVGRRSPEVRPAARLATGGAPDTEAG